ncbi:MAG: hypothetical protein AB7K41_08110 [Bdellovibrionales bacterium]
MSGDSIPTFQAPESDYCDTFTFYADLTSTLEGFARYQRREPFGTFLTGGLGAPGAARPIRRAEVRVTNAAGATIQCGETDNTGFYSLVVPRNAGALTVTVYARGLSNLVKAAVYDDPRYNNTYSISGSVTTSTPIHTLPDMLASATGNVYGGAFNIFDQMVEANDYLRSKVSNCSGTFASCPNFSVAPRVTAYWKLGFNPAEYYGNNSGISYYIPGYYRLFILGGIDGDYNSSDTDHFDNSVILHEYGHFLEDALFTSDSPGGSHNGNKVIDPRLAWSEGWGNFFQAAVRNDPTYIDTEGNTDGSTSYLFLVNLEDQTRDIPTSTYINEIGGSFSATGEGNFREFSVTRLLWDAVDGTATESNGSGNFNDNITDRFIELYHSLSSASGWLKTSVAFRQIGLMHQFQSTLSTTSWANLRGLERHTASTADYAQYVSVGSSCVSFTLIPADVAGDTGSYSTSHLFVNNDFYYLKVPSTTTANIVLTYHDADDAGVDADLDLFIYNEMGRFGNSADIVAQSMKEPAQDPTRTKTEGVNTTLSSGNYLINVMAFTGSAGGIGGATNYSLTFNGSQLCPASLP